MTKIKIGVSIKPVVSIMKDLQEFLEDIFADAEGLKDVEVHTNDLDEFDIFLLEIAEKLGVRYSIHCPHFYSEARVNLCSSEKKEFENAEFWLEKSVDYAKKLDAKNIIIHPDKPGEGASKKEALDVLERHIRNNLKGLSSGQKILVENMPDEKYALSTPEEFKIFLKRFKGKFANKVGVCWDVGHEIARFKKQEFIFPKKLKSKIKEVHVSGVENFHDHLSLTKGNLKLKDFVKSLKDIKYNGAVIFEIVTENPIEIIESKRMIEKFL